MTGSSRRRCRRCLLPDVVPGLRFDDTDLCDICLVVPSWSIHRTQETHTLLLHLLWDQVQVALGEPDVL
jgi:hypothetical protein